MKNKCNQYHKMGFSCIGILYLVLITDCVYGNRLKSYNVANSSDSDELVKISRNIPVTLTSSSTSISVERGSRTASFSSSRKNNDTSAINTPITTRRILRTNGERNDKLMNVLQARRTEVNRVRWRKEFNPIKIQQRLRKENLVEDSSTPEINLVISRLPNEEIFDTDETVHGMFVVNPGKLELEENAPHIKLAKETNNYISNSNRNKTNKSTKLTPTKYYSSTSPNRSLFEARSKRNRGKNLQISTEKSLEDSELQQYSYFGQKLYPTVTTYRSINISTRNKYLNSKRSKSKEESVEVADERVKSSTEKSKLRHSPSRNIVAFNLRRQNQTAAIKIETLTTTTTEATTQRENTQTPSSTFESFIEDVTLDSKNIYSRSTNLTMASTKSPTASTPTTSTTTTTITTQEPTTEITTTEIPIKSDENESKEIHQDYPSLFNTPLIINIPDDAVPENFQKFEEIEYKTENPTISPTIEISDSAANIEEVTETMPPNQYEYETPRNLASIPDINHIFRNVTTTTEMPSNKDDLTPETVIIIYSDRTISSSTSKSISRTTISTSVQSTAASPQYEMAEEATTSAKMTSTTLKPTSPEPSTTTHVPSTPNTSKSDETDSLSMMNKNMTEAGFNLTHSFPNLTGSTSTNSPIYSIIFTASPPVDAQPSTVSTVKKPNDDMAASVISQHNNDVVIEMRKMNTATFILAGLGMLPILIIILYVVKVFVLKRASKVSRDLERYLPDGKPPISPVVRLEQSDTSSTTDESIMTEHDFNRKNLRFKSLLGEGNFGQVWKAEADDLAGHLGTTRIVAVKTERSENGHGDLKAEAEIMKKLAAHPNVVTLLGACLEQEPHLLIMEYAMRGRLLSLLRAARGAVNGIASSIHHNRTPIMPLSPRRLTGFAHDIARGMEYIAEKKIVHRDLAARNVLLDHNGICKICDFGMSVDLDSVRSSYKQIKIPRVQQSESKFRFDLSARAFGIGKHSEKSQSHENKCRPALPIRWMAPEALQYHIFSSETDVWAFGIVMWEIATLGCTPYPNLTGREVVRNVPNGARPDIPPDCRPELYDLMQRTWRKDPRQRPTFSDCRINLARTLCQWNAEDNEVSNNSEYLDVSGFSEDLEQGMVYFNRRISEFECEI